MADCYYCGGPLCWDCDFTFEDCGYEGEGLVSILHCMKCGANVEYTLRYDKEEDNDGEVN